MNRIRTFVVTALASACLASTSGPILLVEDAALPTASISWPVRSGETVAHERTLRYTSSEDRTVVGDNLEMFVAIGGTRLDKGAGHPDGAIVRVGFYKSDVTRPFFRNLANDATITVEVKGVKFNQPVLPHERTAMQHLKYTLADVAACGLDETAMDQYNTTVPEDTMFGKITPENARPGGLDGKSKGSGSVTLKREEDGTISMHAEIPYALFRHCRDPWLRTAPGSFFEPYHFHIEFEVLPEEIAKEIEATGQPLKGSVIAEPARSST